LTDAARCAPVAPPRSWRPAQSERADAIGALVVVHGSDAGRSAQKAVPLGTAVVTETDFTERQRYHGNLGFAARGPSCSVGPAP
jgi:hypothetical protein